MHSKTSNHIHLKNYAFTSDLEPETEMETLFSTLIDASYYSAKPLFIHFSGFQDVKFAALCLSDVLKYKICDDLTLDFSDAHLELQGMNALFESIISGQQSGITLHFDAFSDFRERSLICRNLRDANLPQLQLSVYLCDALIEAMKYNKLVSILIKPDEKPCFLPVIGLINQRNALLKRYPEYAQNILHFCKTKNFFSGNIEKTARSEAELPPEIHAFFKEVSAAHIDEIYKELKNDSTKKRLKKMENYQDKDLQQAFLKLPFAQLMEQDLIIQLYLNGDHALRKEIMVILRANIQFIAQSDSIIIIALLIAHGEAIKPAVSMDPVYLELLVHYFREPGNTKEINSDKKPITAAHLMLAKKISPELHEALIQPSNNQPFSYPEDVEKLRFLQNSIRIRNRTCDLYPAIFRLKTNSPENTYASWNERVHLKINNMDKKLQSIAQAYIDTKRKTLNDGQPFYFPYKSTAQYIISFKAMENILNGGYLLSQKVREQADIFSSSQNDYEDRITGDNALVCTAPLDISPPIEDNSYAIIYFDLTKIPALTLQNCILKSSDYTLRKDKSRKVDLTPSIQMHILPYPRKGCVLFRMDSNPEHCAFDKLPLEPGSNAFILYKDSLFYAERIGKTVKQRLFCTSQSKIFDVLKSKFTDIPTQMDEASVPLFTKLTGIAQLDRSVSRYRFDNIHISYTLEISGTQELFHGLNGFKETLIHFLYLIHALPNTGPGKIIKDKLLIHLENLQDQDLLHDYLDDIFDQLFRFMEIDFPYGLPFSLDYVSKLQLVDYSVDFKKILRQASQGKVDSFEPEFMNIPFIMQQILMQVPPPLFPSIFADLQKKFPESCMLAIEGWPQLFNKSNSELKAFASQMPYIKNKHYDLSALLETLKQYLSRYPEKCPKTAKIPLMSDIKTIYKDFTVAGGESKLREVFLDTNIMQALTSNQGEMIAQIIALAIRAETNPASSRNIEVCTVISQRTMKEIKITLYSILSGILKQPTRFLERFPLNNPSQTANHHTEHVKHILLEYIEQRILFKYHYNMLEQSILDLCKNIPDIVLDDYLLKKHKPAAENCMVLKQNFFSKTASHKKKWEGYKEYLQDLAFINEDFSNNNKIIQEINDILIYVIKFICTEEKPTLNELVHNMLHSTALISPDIAHFLFDATHFPIALKGKNIDQIPVADRIFKNILVVEKKPAMEDFQQDMLMVQRKSGYIIVYWHDRHQVESHYIQTEMNDPFNQLPDSGSTSDPRLIQYICDKSICAKQSISFHELIIACIDTLSKTGINPSNALMAEQLSLRIKKLQCDFVQVSCSTVSTHFENS